MPQIMLDIATVFFFVPRFINSRILTALFYFQADGTYETQSSLMFTASRFENGGTLTCEAINSVMIDRDEPPIKSTLLLEVMCK